MCRPNEEPNRQRAKFAAIGVLCIVLIGCSTVNEASLPPSEQTRQQLGVVGVRVIGETPELGFETPLRGRGYGAAQGAAAGAAAGALEALDEIGRHNSDLGVVAFIILVPVGIIAGGIAGASYAVPEEEAQKIEATIASVFTSVPIDDEVTSGLQQSVDAHLNRSVVFLDGSSTESTDTVLDVNINRAGLAGGRGSNPNLTVFVEAEFKVTRASDGTIMHHDRALQFSGVRMLSEWTENDAAALREALTSTYRRLGEEIIEEVFLVWRPSL